MDIKDEEPRHQIIARQIQEIMKELDNIKSKSVSVSASSAKPMFASSAESVSASSAKPMFASSAKSVSASSARQQDIDSDDRRIISPGNLGAVTGQTNESITTTIIQILDVNDENHIKKLKHLAKLLYNIEYFKKYNVSYIYKILVWIALRILIDSKKATLVGYDEYRKKVYEQIESGDVDTIIKFLTIKKPFYRIIDYDQLLYLFNSYASVLRLQEVKKKRKKTARDIPEIVIDETKITHSKTVSILTVLSSCLTHNKLIDRRIFNKIQKAIKKLRAKDTTKKINI